MANDAAQNTTKTSGYLLKKGKMKMMSSWKKYWFVLEGRSPLVYYRSKNEYDAISPCKGTINLGPPCTITPIGGTLCFQLETRRNTITLKADNKKEYEKWLEVIVQALNQSCSSGQNNRMSHFRYSSENLTPVGMQNKDKKNHAKLIRQNTMPIQDSTASSRSSKGSDIIQRLQNIGAQRYGGSLVQLSALSSKNSSSSQSLNSNKRMSNEIIENYDLYAGNNLVKKKSTFSIASLTNRLSKSSLNNVIVENDQYCTQEDFEEHRKSTRDQDVQMRQRYDNGENLYERISDDSIRSDGMEGSSQINSGDSDLYSCINDSAANARSSSDSSHCGQPTDTLVATVYSLPLASDQIEKIHMMENDQYISSVPSPESEYAECGNFNDDAIYEDVDKIKKSYRGSYPKAKSEESRTSTSSSTDSMNHKKLERTTSDKPRRRKKSFFNKIMTWKRKSKDKTEELDLGSSMESVENKLKVANDLEVLTELQRILDAKKSEIEKKLSLSTNNNNDLQKELTNTLLTLQQVHSNNSDKTDKDIAPNWRPVLPDKNSLKNVQQERKLKTIDEILEDLDKEKNAQESRLKVKELIERFEVEDVQFRKRSASEKNTPRNDTRRHSNDLMKLLEDLAKVTNAPIMQPGVTSSLVSNHHTTDDEWLNLVPIRHRRLSDPDYDIPRPHRSLIQANNNNKINSNKTNKESKDAKPNLTLLEKATNIRSTNTNFDMLLPSMTPDSLEISTLKNNADHLEKNSNTTKVDEDFEEKMKKLEEDSLSEKVEEVIYACPRQIMGQNFTYDVINNNNYENVMLLKNNRNSRDAEFYDYRRRSSGNERPENGQVQNYFRSKSLDESGIKSLDVFVDSLEPSSELSTIF